MNAAGNVRERENNPGGPDGRKELTSGKESLSVRERKMPSPAAVQPGRIPAVVEPLCLSHSKWVGNIHGKCPGRSSPALQEQLNPVPQRGFPSPDLWDVESGLVWPGTTPGSNAQLAVPAWSSGERVLEEI